MARLDWERVAPSNLEKRLMEIDFRKLRIPLTSKQLHHNTRQDSLPNIRVGLVDSKAMPARGRVTAFHSILTNTYSGEIWAEELTYFRL